MSDCKKKKYIRRAMAGKAVMRGNVIGPRTLNVATSV